MEGMWRVEKREVGGEREAYDLATWELSFVVLFCF